MSKGIKFNLNKIREYNSKKKKRILKISSIITCSVVLVIWMLLKFLFKM